jgi:hypothetical protein
MADKFAIYQENSVHFDSDTGEVKKHFGHNVQRLPSKKQEPYIKVYKYLNTLFGFRGIPSRLTPYIIEFGRHMGNPEEEQEIEFTKRTKLRICETMGVKIDRLNKIIAECVKYDLLRKTEDRGRYTVNPYIISQGDNVEITKLQAHFDFMAENVIVGAEQDNLITGTTVKKAITIERKGKKELKGQINLFSDETSAEVIL